MTPIANVDSIAFVRGGPVRDTIRITRTWQSSHFIQDISLDEVPTPSVIDNDIDWHETHVLLKAAFPLAATGPKATYEIPYGSIERTTTRSNSWEKAKFEVPAQRWADLGDAKQGLSLLNDVKFGYDAEGNTLRLTLLRSATWPDEVADKGRQQFRYALYPHGGSWKQAQTVHRGYELNDPLKAEQVFPHTGSLPAEHSWASIENPNVTLTAIKKAEDSDALIFRMYEWAGEPTQVKLHIPPGATSATETNLMEKPEGAPLSISNDTITVSIKPYEILTIQATYPVHTNHRGRQMIPNRSVPTDTVLPHIAYRNLNEAIPWLTRTFGFPSTIATATPSAEPSSSLAKPASCSKPQSPKAKPRHNSATEPRASPSSSKTWNPTSSKQSPPEPPSSKTSTRPSTASSSTPPLISTATTGSSLGTPET